MAGYYYRQLDREKRGVYDAMLAGMTRSRVHCQSKKRALEIISELDIGLAGIEVYDILRDEYDIQIEFGDIGNILAYLSIGDRPQEIERLVSALAEIKRRYHTDGTGLLSQEYIDPVVAASPQEAFYAPKKSLPLRETEGMVCSEFVMCYPPGIPILAPGERITAEILDYIEYAKAKGCSMTGPEDPDILRLNVPFVIMLERLCKVLCCR